MLPKPASGRALLAAVTLGLLGTLEVLEIALNLSGETSEEPVLALLTALAFGISAIGVYAGRFWAWWLGSVSLLVDFGWWLASTEVRHEPMVSAVFGIAFLLFGALLRLFTSPSMLGRGRPPQALAVHVLSWISTVALIGGAVLVAFEVDAILAGTLAVVLGGLLVRKGRRRLRQPG